MLLREVCGGAWAALSYKYAVRLTNIARTGTYPSAVSDFSLLRFLKSA